MSIIGKRGGWVLPDGSFDMRERAGEDGLSPCKKILKSFLEMPLKFERGIF